MGRRAEPWRRGGKDWYVTHKGRQVRLADASATKTQAWEAYRELLSGRVTPEDGPDFAGIASAYMRRQKARLDRGELSQQRYTLGIYHLSRACQAFGAVAVAELRPKHINDWLDSQKTWGRTTRADGIAWCRAVVRWAIDDGEYRGDNPLKGLRSPAQQKRSRDSVPRDDELDAIRTCRPDPEWRDLMDVLVATGCRPGEIYTLTASDIDFKKGVMSVKNKTARATGLKRRIVYLTPEVLVILRRNAERHPDGEVLRNTKGTRWRNHAVRQAIVKAGFKTFPYALRHAYGSRGIKQVDVATLAKLMGHTRIKTTLDNYVHNFDTDDEIRRSAEKINRGLPGRPASKRPGTDPGE